MVEYSAQRKVGGQTVRVLRRELLVRGEGKTQSILVEHSRGVVVVAEALSWEALERVSRETEGKEVESNLSAAAHDLKRDGEKDPHAEDEDHHDEERGLPADENHALNAVRGRGEEEDAAAPGMKNLEELPCQRGFESRLSLMRAEPAPNGLGASKRGSKRMNRSVWT